MKQLIYETPINTIEELKNRIEIVAAEIRENPEIIMRTQQSMVRRAEACVRNGGHHFEVLL
jgi:hypothetical protein